MFCASLWLTLEQSTSCAAATGSEREPEDSHDEADEEQPLGWASHGQEPPGGRCAGVRAITDIGLTCQSQSPHRCWTASRRPSCRRRWPAAPPRRSWPRPSAGAGGLGFLATGYKTADAVHEELKALSELTSSPFGVNVFVPGEGPPDPTPARRYAQRLRDEGLDPGEPRWEDDAWAAKVELLLAERPRWPPSPSAARPPKRSPRLRDAGVEVWVTVTSPAEASLALGAGADALVAQGVEAGGHRGAFGPDTGGEYGLLALLALLGGPDSPRPLVATGGIATAPTVAAVLAAGARAAQVGTAFMRCPEAGTAAPHREALGSPGRDPPHARVQRQARAGDREPLPGRARGRSRRVPRAPPRDRTRARRSA